MQSGIDILIDTNILIYWLQGNQYAAEILATNNIYFSIITEIEIKGHISFLDPLEKEKIQKILNRFKKIKLTEPIKELAIEYKIQYNLKTPDAIIAATARYLKMPLITADKKVSGIENIVVVLFTSSN